MSRNILFIVALAALTGVSYYLIDAMERRSVPLPIYGPEDHQIEEFSFNNQEDVKINSSDLNNRVWIVNYFFTSCPSICPKMMRNMQSVHNIVRDDREVVMLSLTVDPKRDTPDRLMTYTKKLNVNHDTWHLLTGDKKDLYRLARKSFFISATDGGGDEYDFIHSENIIVIDKEGRIRAIVNGTSENAADEILNAVAKLRTLT